MSKVIFIPYASSKGLNLLVTSLRERGITTQKIKTVGSSYTGNSEDIIINWGGANRRNVRNTFKVFNDPVFTRNASNKIRAFTILKENGMQNYIPKFTTSKEEAIRFIREGNTVYCRTSISSSQGRGIVIANTEYELVDAPLYTCGVPCTREIRVHVFNNEVIDFSQKKRMNNERLREENISVSETIRNHNNGWVFARENVQVSENVKRVSTDAVRSLGLDFGAVDIVESEDSIKILEINTAPGMVGETVTRYTDAIVGLM